MVHFLSINSFNTKYCLLPPSPSRDFCQHWATVEKVENHDRHYYRHRGHGHHKSKVDSWKYFRNIHQYSFQLFRLNWAFVSIKLTFPIGISYSCIFAIPKLYKLNSINVHMKICYYWISQLPMIFQSPLTLSNCIGTV